MAIRATRRSQQLPA